MDWRTYLAYFAIGPLPILFVVAVFVGKWRDGRKRVTVNIGSGVTHAEGDFGKAVLSALTRARAEGRIVRDYTHQYSVDLDAETLTEIKPGPKVGDTVLYDGGEPRELDQIDLIRARNRRQEKP